MSNPRPCPCDNPNPLCPFLCDNPTRITPLRQTYPLRVFATYPATLRPATTCRCDMPIHSFSRRASPLRLFYSRRFVSNHCDMPASSSSSPCDISNLVNSNPCDHPTRITPLPFHATHLSVPVHSLEVAKSFLSRYGVARRQGRPVRAGPEKADKVLDDHRNARRNFLTLTLDRFYSPW